MPCVRSRYSPILEGDEIWLRGTLPYDAMTRAMLDAGVPAQTGALSPADADAPLPFKSTTGMYLCNYMTYRLAQLSRETGMRDAAQTDEERTRLLTAPLATMPLEMMVKGTRAALKACLD